MSTTLWSIALSSALGAKRSKKQQAHLSVFVTVQSVRLDTLPPAYQALAKWVTR